MGADLPPPPYLPLGQIGLNDVRLTGIYLFIQSERRKILRTAGLRNLSRDYNLLLILNRSEDWSNRFWACPPDTMHLHWKPRKLSSSACTYSILTERPREDWRRWQWPTWNTFPQPGSSVDEKRVLTFLWRGGNLFRLLKIWRGSIFKGVWRNLAIFCSCYAFVSITYRC